MRYATMQLDSHVHFSVVFYVLFCLPSAKQHKRWCNSNYGGMRKVCCFCLSCVLTMEQNKRCCTRYYLGIRERVCCCGFGVVLYANNETNQKVLQAKLRRDEENRRRIQAALLDFRNDSDDDVF